ncbi:uncharacterized protein EI90DRAFT_3072864 [Cantharellus anzutake]|uniref:uncharacterized protein n=1 Tax=Cantharellus anzutake TaxID=1750568 RepID=UPI00190531F6|nr:uncharacterized protein EI90DRAFT_3072864 [Cantharellus anzutake]KAF8325440.1 hypothetical protein EI90DRAFT_3072864 [Cantharellus anzutake]
MRLSDCMVAIPTEYPAGCATSPSTTDRAWEQGQLGLTHLIVRHACMAPAPWRYVPGALGTTAHTELPAGSNSTLTDPQ